MQRLPARQYYGMKRLTTPTHKFVLDIDPREWDEFRITYSQIGTIVLEKTEADKVSIEVGSSTPTRYTMTIRLTQAETALFKPNKKVEMQIRCHYPDGSAFASDVMTVNVHDVLNQEMLGDEG